MKLYNCSTDLEKTLKNIVLSRLTVIELKELRDMTQEAFTDGELENEIIVMDVLSQIVDELVVRFLN